MSERFIGRKRKFVGKPRKCPGLRSTVHCYVGRAGRGLPSNVINVLRQRSIRDLPTEHFNNTFKIGASQICKKNNIDFVNNSKNKNNGPLTWRRAAPGVAKLRVSHKVKLSVTRPLCFVWEKSFIG